MKRKQEESQDVGSKKPKITKNEYLKNQFSHGCSTTMLHNPYSIFNHSSVPPMVPPISYNNMDVLQPTMPACQDPPQNIKSKKVYDPSSLNPVYKELFNRFELAYSTENNSGTKGIFDDDAMLWDVICSLPQNNDELIQILQIRIRSDAKKCAAIHIMLCASFPQNGIKTRYSSLPMSEEKLRRWIKNKTELENIISLAPTYKDSAFANLLERRLLRSSYIKSILDNSDKKNLLNSNHALEQPPEQLVQTEPAEEINIPTLDTIEKNLPSMQLKMSLFNSEYQLGNDTLPELDTEKSLDTLFIL